MLNTKREGEGKNGMTVSPVHHEFNCYQLLWPPVFINNQVISLPNNSRAVAEFLNIM